MKHVAGISVFGLLVCQIVVAPASARAIRSDDNPSNNWGSCADATQCAKLPSGLSFNPFGTDPSAAPSPTAIMGGLNVFAPAPDGFDAQSPCSASGSTCSANSWQSPVPGIEYLFGSSAQVMFFDLSGNPSETVYGPNLDAGNPVALGSAAVGTTAWEIEFNYATTPTTSASFEFGGNIYTASANVLSPTNLNEFVFYGNTLHAPSGWSEGPATTSAPEIDPASAIGGLTLLSGCLLALRGGRRTLRVSV
jgi:hypothetical protein